MPFKRRNPPPPMFNVVLRKVMVFLTNAGRLLPSSTLNWGGLGCLFSTFYLVCRKVRNWRQIFIFVSRVLSSSVWVARFRDIPKIGTYSIFLWCFREVICYLLVFWCLWLVENICGRIGGVVIVTVDIWRQSKYIRILLFSTECPPG